MKKYYLACWSAEGSSPDENHHISKITKIQIFKTLYSLFIACQFLDISASVLPALARNIQNRFIHEHSLQTEIK